MEISRRRLIASTAAGASLAFVPRFAAAQASWPVKPIRVIVGFAAGGQTDIFARTYGEYLKAETGQNVIVENKPGANGSIAAAEVKQAAPDGHTLLFTVSVTMTTNHLLFKDIAYNPVKDFTIVSALPTGSIPTVASEKTGARTLAEFIDYARRTEKVSVGTFGAGSYSHLVVSELNRQYNLKIEAVHYRGEAPMWTDLAGQVLDAATGSYNGSRPVLESGRGRAIAVSQKRISKMPEVPTFSEQGASSPVFSLTTYQCCAVPSGTPDDVVRQLSRLLVDAGKTDKVKQMLNTFGIADGAMDFDATQSLYKREAPIWIDLVSGLRITP